MFMEFTFGIITSGNNFQQIMKIIESIKNLSIKNYEILIIGGDNTYETEESVRYHPFNDELKKGWITKKKNIITKKAKYENIVYLHDYIIFDKNWYKGFLKFGNEYDIAMNKILNKDKKRFRDWTLWPENENFIDDIVSQKLNCLLPYNEDHLSNYMYISGTYWVAKKKVMEEFPLNEKLLWGEGEDVEWSKRVRQKYKFKMNKYSTVMCLKQKRNDFKKTSFRDLNKINKYIKESKNS